MSSFCVKSSNEPRDSILPIDETDIIDISAMNLDDDDNWLCEANEACASTKCQPHVPVHCNLEVDDLYLTRGNRKAIDTRTYTRAKRRSSRPSFESVLNIIASPTSPQKTEFLADYCSTPLPFKLKEASGETSTIPHMLRPNFKTYSMFTNDNNVLAQTSGPESMENFLNISQSKGADSFMNIVEPNFSDLMNESQPSALYSSLTTRDDTSLSTDILTNSMMQSSMFDEVKDVFIPFETDHLNVTTVKMEQTCANHNNVEAENMELDEISYLSLGNDVTMTLNSTFDSFQSEKQTNPEVDKNSFREDNYLNTTYSKTIIDLNTTLPLNETVESPRRGTFLVRNATFDKTHQSDVLNRTFERKVTPKKDNLNKTFDTIQPDVQSPKSKDLNATFDAVNDKESEALQVALETARKVTSDENLHTTFNAKRIPESLNTTFNTTKMPEVRQMELPKPKVVTSLRQELLQEIRRNENKHLDSTYDVNSQKENVEEQTNLTFNKNDAQNLQKSSKLVEKNHLGRKFTFMVKNNTLEKNDGENLNSTFLKPLDQQPKKVKRRLPGPIIYSKAPCYLQKSNPNLISGSLNTAISTDNVARPSLLKYPRGSQPNITMNAQKNSLGRFKSGSDQRLKDVTYDISDFHIAATSGSTESIESTQSAHSAPDLDDRLSNCSENSSRGSYTIGKMDSDKLHKIAQLQEESLRYESTPKPDRNDDKFMKTEDLPSPISKHGNNALQTDATRKIPKTDFETSSPNDSPSSLNQAINIAAGATSKSNTCQTKQQNPNTMVKKLEIPAKRQSKIAGLTEAKSKLRQPTNFNSANRPLSAASGIPRPMSRIPAPKATRPKTAQSDVKKGYL